MSLAAFKVRYFTMLSLIDKTSENIFKFQTCIFNCAILICEIFFLPEDLSFGTVYNIHSVEIMKSNV